MNIFKKKDTEKPIDPEIEKYKQSIRVADEKFGIKYSVVPEPKRTRPNLDVELEQWKNDIVSLNKAKIRKGIHSKDYPSDD